MIRKILDSERMSLSKAARRVGVHTGTLWRWALSGVGGRKLVTVKIGGRRFVLVRDLEEFLEAANSNSASPSVLPSSAEKRAEAAERKLEEWGM